MEGEVEVFSEMAAVFEGLTFSTSAQVPVPRLRCLAQGLILRCCATYLGFTDALRHWSCAEDYAQILCKLGIQLIVGEPWHINS